LLGISGALIALWATFVPCFLWIFTAAPYIEWLTYQPRLKGALTGIMAAVVGVIGNLCVWFALHIFFAETFMLNLGLLTVWVPDVTTTNWFAVVMGVFLGCIVYYKKVGVFPVLGVGAVCGLLAGLFSK